MSEIAKREKYWWENYPLYQIWCNDACPLVPRFKYRPGNEHNANSWWFHWLLIHMWSMEHFSFGVDAEISPQNGIYVGCILPYLRITIGIRHTWYEWQSKLANVLHRKPAIKKETQCLEKTL